jgi:hypothetical protein
MSHAASKAVPDFGQMMLAWAEATPSVSGLVLIGSRARAATDRLEFADPHSDWDFHLISSRPELFLDPRWTEGIPGLRLKAYVARSAVIGGVPKIALVTDQTEADLVIIPAALVRRMKWGAALGLHRRAGWTRRRMQNIGEVIRPGWLFLKGAGQWGRIYERTVTEVTDPRLGDAQVRELAEGFFCDYVWTLRKVARGELRTAQRMLHRELAEVNFQLLHELKQRRGERSLNKARRIERTAAPAELDLVTVEAALSAAALRSALEKSAAGCQALVAALIGPGWIWPERRG